MSVGVKPAAGVSSGVPGKGHQADTHESHRPAPTGIMRIRSSYFPLLAGMSRNRPYMQLLKQAAKLPGDAIECGVFRGRSLLRMATHLNSVDRSKTFFGLDSFAGFPEESVSGIDLGPGKTLEKVRARFKNTGSAKQRIERVARDLGLNIKACAGYFEYTLPDIAANRVFCFAHIDCDVYDSYRTCLNLLYEKVVPGGIILFDEYNCPVWPGATKAVDEFFVDKPEKPLECVDLGRPEKPKFYIQKQ